MFVKTLSTSLVFAAVNAATDKSYNYDDIGDNWAVEGFHSPDCLSGKEQSPIDLVKSTFSTDRETTMKFEGYNYNDWAEGQTLNRLEHGMKMTIGDKPVLREQFPDGSTDQFYAAQLHFHAPSEHSVDGKLYPLEMHIVHLHEVNASSSFSVIGVFFEVGDEPNEYIASLDFANVTEAGNPLTNVNLGSFLAGLDMTKFWHYDGSFTTPPCTEGVKWWVIEKPVKISQQQLDDFTDHGWGNADYSNGQGNNRRVQPLNDRTLYYRDSTMSMSGSMALAVGSAALTLLALF